VLSAAVIRQTNDLQMVTCLKEVRAILKKTIYRHKAAALGYGLKLWPEDFATVKAKAHEALNLEGL
jgi:hypothetical protein